MYEQVPRTAAASRRIHAQFRLRTLLIVFAALAGAIAITGTWLRSWTSERSSTDRAAVTLVADVPEVVGDWKWVGIERYSIESAHIYRNLLTGKKIRAVYLEGYPFAVAQETLSRACLLSYGPTSSVTLDDVTRASAQSSWVTDYTSGAVRNRLFLWSYQVDKDWYTADELMTTFDRLPHERRVRKLFVIGEPSEQIESKCFMAKLLPMLSEK